jgi:hypothetical protein
MSKQFIIKSFSITLFGFLAGYTGMQTLQNQELQNESHFSSYSAPTKTLTKLGSEAIYQDYFDVRIKHENISENKNDSSAVKALITARKNLPAGLSFVWTLGEGVSAHSNQLKGTLPEIKQDQTAEIELTVYGFNKTEKSYLSFEINGSVENKILQKEVLTSSRPEDSFEYTVQQAHQKELTEQTKPGSSKVLSINKNRFNLKNIVK